MKSRNLIYSGVVVMFSLLLASCVSYEATSYKKKNTSSNRYTYSSTKSGGSKSKTKTAATPKKTTSGTKSVALKSNSTTAKSKDVKLVLNEAEKYKGTPYKYGGTTSSGIDCSGLVSVAFQKIDMKLPRRSVDMSNQGSAVSISNAKEGDLLFFATGGGSINHVGIVYNIASSGEVSFIHASTSKGVMISSLEENYWKGKFVKARRVL